MSPFYFHHNTHAVGDKLKNHDGKLAVISNSSDLMEAQALQHSEIPSETKMELVASTVDSMKKFNSSDLQGLFDYFVIFVSIDVHQIKWNCEIDNVWFQFVMVDCLLSVTVQRLV